jgi:Asp/Glu/hydantoin racemase
MSKFDECMAKYTSSISAQSVAVTVNEALLTKVAKGLGPSIYLGDASMVSCSDQSELDRVKNNFLIKKMGLADSAKLDAAIKTVCDQMGSSNRTKHRAVFYYLLVENLGLQGKY